MSVAESARPDVYVLPLPESAGALSRDAAGGSAQPIPENLLVENVLWFCRLRWVIAAIMAAVGVLGLMPGALLPLSISMRADWPLLTAALLALSNAVYLPRARRIGTSPPYWSPTANLWTQIVVDLLLLTMVVHFVGSVETYVSFAYLFHIVLACIFFPRAQSLVVVVIASVLYTACIAGEMAGLIPPAGIFPQSILRIRTQLPLSALVLVHSLALASWFSVWYLASHLSAMVRRRDVELASANRRLTLAQEERAKHLLRTTHELKAPFAAIQANTQLLLKGYCGVLPSEALDVISRISSRCRRLAREIQEMLQIANLKSHGSQPLPFTEVDLKALLEWCASQVTVTAKERDITIEKDLVPAFVSGVEGHLKMLFANLLGNAVSYSHPYARVFLRCKASSGGFFDVTVEDHGIGIAAEKLPHIFDEYYRTNEAVKHNNQSSGLGLAIVRHVVQSHGISLRVESHLGAGTKVELRLKAAEAVDTVKRNDS